MNEASPDPRSRTPEEVACASLHHALAYGANVRTALARAVELLRGSRVDEATELYAQTLDALNVLVFVLTTAAAQLGEAGAPLRGIDGDCATWIASLSDAQEHGDWTALADCLEYEVTPDLESWNERVEGILRRSA